MDKTNPIITTNLTKLLVTFNQAIVKKEIIGVVGPPGIGFKYAVRHFAEKHYLKVVYGNVKYSESIREVLLSLTKHLCNVKFSNLNYRETTLFDLTRILNHRLQIGDSCLLCLDNCSNLKPAQLKYFIQFLNNFDKPIGLVFRMNQHYVDRLERSKDFTDTFHLLMKVVDNWRVLERCADDELQDIVSKFVKSNPMVATDLVNASNGNLSTMMIHIRRYLALQQKKGRVTPIPK